MSGFRIGRFDREKVGWFLRHFSPISSHNGLSDVLLDALYATGKRLVLLDVDNTLLLWKSEEIPQETLDWLGKGRKLGMEFCIISNTRRVNRLGRLADRLGVPYVRGRFKPSRQMFRVAMGKYGVTSEQTVMVGDQLFTDVLGANRAGIDAIWVKPMGERELFMTRFNRIFERKIRDLLYPSLLAEGATAGAVVRAAPSALVQKKLFQQFIKFCLVGGVSTFVDLGIHYMLMFRLETGNVLVSARLTDWLAQSFGLGSKPAADVAFGLLKIPAVLLAILNSFYMNRLWTFRIVGQENRRRQLVKFYAVALIGMVINVGIVSSLNAVIPGHPKRSWAIASAIATVVVAFWNFSGQRFWTFRGAHR